MVLLCLPSQIAIKKSPSIIKSQGEDNTQVCGFYVSMRTAVCVSAYAIVLFLPKYK